MVDLFIQIISFSVCHYDTSMETFCGVNAGTFCQSTNDGSNRQKHPECRFGYFFFFIIMILCQNANEKFIHSEWDLCIESYMTYGCLLFGCQIVRIVIVRQLQDWQMFSHQKRCAHRKRRKSAMRANQSHGMLLLSLLRCLAHRFSHRGNFPSITKHHRYAFIIYNLAMMNWLNFVASVHTQMP